MPVRPRNSGLSSGRAPYKIEIRNVRARADSSDQTTVRVVLLRYHGYLFVDEVRRDGGVQDLSSERASASDLDPVLAGAQAALDLVFSVAADPPAAARPWGSFDRNPGDRSIGE